MQHLWDQPFSNYRTFFRKTNISYPLIHTHCVKGIQNGPYFPVFGLNTEIYSRIQPEYRKIRTRKNSVFGHFSCSDTNVQWMIALIIDKHGTALKNAGGLTVGHVPELLSKVVYYFLLHEGGLTATAMGMGNM